MNAPDKALLSRLYNNRELVPDHPQYMARWAEASARARGTMTCYLDRRYGEQPGETVDLFPARKGDGSCLMFIHGGYWRSLDKHDFSFLAPALVDAGISLAVVNYDLCPKVTIEVIVQQMLRASRWLWLHAEDYGMDQDRLYVGGHSAGGHLTAMLMCALWPVFDRRLPKDLWKGGLAISGIYDLEPIRHIYVNEKLGLDEAEARRNSPGKTGKPLTIAYGAAELPALRQQSEDYAKKLGVKAVALPGHNHFTVLEELASPHGALTALVRRLVQ
jgi:arylformamidase